jgi:hypothetical protein
MTDVSGVIDVELLGSRFVVWQPADAAVLRHTHRLLGEDVNRATMDDVKPGERTDAQPPPVPYPLSPIEVYFAYKHGWVQIVRRHPLPRPDTAAVLPPAAPPLSSLPGSVPVPLPLGLATSTADDTEHRPWLQRWTEAVTEDFDAQVMEQKRRAERLKTAALLRQKKGQKLAQLYAGFSSAWPLEFVCFAFILFPSHLVPRAFRCCSKRYRANRTPQCACNTPTLQVSRHRHAHGRNHRRRHRHRRRRYHCCCCCWC